LLLKLGAHFGFVGKPIPDFLIPVQVSFEIGFEGGVGVDRSKMRREELQIEAPACRKPRGCRCVAKMTNIEGRRYGER